MTAPRVPSGAVRDAFEQKAHASFTAYGGPAGTRTNTERHE